jgi:hypothetical protein
LIESLDDKGAVMITRFRTMALAMVGTIVLGGAAVGMIGVQPAAAYGPANWQMTFAGTGPGFGFWGWCDLAGGTTFSSGLATSGTTGDCQFAEYVHQPGASSGTCEESLNLQSEGGQPAWDAAPSRVTGVADWFLSGTAVIHPPAQATFCPTLTGSFPPTFSGLDSLLPVAPGHTNLSGVFGTTEFQLQETPLK